jgi:hypothetical protein
VDSGVGAEVPLHADATAHGLVNVPDPLQGGRVAEQGSPLPAAKIGYGGRSSGGDDCDVHPLIIRVILPATMQRSPCIIVRVLTCIMGFMVGSAGVALYTANVDHDSYTETERLRRDLEAALQLIESAAFRAALLASLSGAPGETAAELLTRALDALADHFDGCTGGDWRDL